MATIAVTRSAPTPTRLRGRGVNYTPRRADMAEEDGIDDQPEEQAEEDAEGETDEDAEGEEEDEDAGVGAQAAEDDEGDEDDGEVVGAVKTRSTRLRRRNTAEEEESEAEENAGDVSGDLDSDGSESGEDNDWEAADDGAIDDTEIKNTDSSHCM